jgi:hypothetical protein
VPHDVGAHLRAGYASILPCERGQIVPYARKVLAFWCRLMPQPKPVERRYYSAKDVCDHTGLSLRTVRKLLAKPFDPMPSIKVDGSVLIPISQLEDWLSRHAVTPARDEAAAAVDAVMKSMQGAR